MHVPRMDYFSILRVGWAWSFSRRLNASRHSMFTARSHFSDKGRYCGKAITTRPGASWGFAVQAVPIVKGTRYGTQQFCRSCTFLPDGGSFAHVAMRASMHASARHRALLSLSFPFFSQLPEVMGKAGTWRVQPCTDAKARVPERPAESLITS